MFRDFFDIAENPFSNTPNPNYLFMSQRHKEALAHLIYGVEGNSGFVLLTGEVGTGKTTLCRYLSERLPENVEMALVINPRLTEIELLAGICDDMGVAVRGSRHSAKDLTDSINTHLLNLYAKGGRAVLIIDEAQNLGFNRLEQIRLLTNLETSQAKLLQIILIGQPELRDLLAQPEMSQLSQRITARYHLDPMTPDEAKSYVGHRLSVAGLEAEVFKSSALSVIIDRSRGVPRLINSICERCMLGAYVAGTKSIDAKLAEKAASEVLGHAGRPRHRILLPMLIGILAGIMGVGFLVIDPLALKLTPKVTETPRIQALRGHLSTWSGTAWMFREKEQVAAVPNAVPTATPTQPASAPASAEPTPAASSPPPDLAGILASAATPSGLAPAMAQLLTLWQPDADSAVGNDPCADAERAGLRCLRGTGTWADLEDLNRPVLVRLAYSAGRRTYALVTVLDGERLRLRVGDRELAATRAELAAFWAGEFIVLWKPPVGEWRALEPGARGEAVTWLRARLSAIRQQSAVAAEPTVYDPVLVSWVNAFKGERNLAEDGVVDALTVIHLNGAPGGPGVPLLTAPTGAR